MPSSTHADYDGYPRVGFVCNTGVASEHERTDEDDGEDEEGDGDCVADQVEGGQLNIMIVSGCFFFVRHGEY